MTGAALPDIRGEVIGWAKDLDVSAIKLSPFERPALGAWLRSDRVNEFDGIMWSRLDRAVRSMADLHTLAQWATTHRKLLVFVSGPGGGAMKLDMRAGPLDPIPHLIVTILAFAAQMEAQAITERIKETKAYMRQSGRWGGGMYPYHLIPVRHGVGWKLADNPETMPILEEILKRALRGDSKASIADYLNQQGYPSPRDYRHENLGRTCTAPIMGRVEEIGELEGIGKGLTIRPEAEGDPVRVRLFPVHAQWAVEVGDHVTEGQRLTLPILWNGKTIRDMLSDRVLLGETTLAGKPVLGPDGMPVKRADPVMSREDWARLQAVIKEAGGSHEGNGGASNRTTGASLMLDIGFCALCGEKLNFRAQAKTYANPYTYAYYNCRSAWGQLKRQTKEERCPAKAMVSDAVEALAEKILMHHIGDEQVLIEVPVARESHKEELEAATAALIDLTERTIGKPEAVQAIYRGQISALEVKVAELAAMPDLEERVDFRETGKTYRQLWEVSDRQDRRRLLMESGVRVEARRVMVGSPRPGQRRTDTGAGVSLGLFQRPERYGDAAVELILEDGVQVAVYLPTDLRKRAGGRGIPLRYDVLTLF